MRPSLAPQSTAIPLQCLCITASVGYRRQTASAVHHVVNVCRFLSYPPDRSSTDPLFLSSSHSSPSLSLVFSHKRVYSSCPDASLPVSVSVSSGHLSAPPFLSSSFAHRRLFKHVLRCTILRSTFFLRTTSLSCSLKSRRSVGSLHLLLGVTAHQHSTAAFDETSFPLLSTCLPATTVTRFHFAAVIKCWGDCGSALRDTESRIRQVHGG